MKEGITMSNQLRKNSITLFIGLCIVASIVWYLDSKKIDNAVIYNIPQYSQIEESSILSADDVRSKLEPSFLNYYINQKNNDIKDTTNVSVLIQSMEYSSVSASGTRKETGLDGNLNEVLVLSDEGSWVEYKVDIPQDGFYQMGISYYALEGKRSSVLRSLQIDGKFPFFQAKRFEFQRMWSEKGDVWLDNQGNEYNPPQQEVFGWQYREFRDAEAKVPEAFRFYLTKGQHTIRLTAIREPAAIGELRLFSPTILKTYKELLQEYKDKGYEVTTNQLIKIQAEDAVLKSDPTLRRIEDREPLTEPINKHAVGLNAFGRDSWRKGGQWAEWTFQVPKSGLYEIGSRFGSWWLDGIPVQRIVTIDGEIPFQEMNSISFRHKLSWVTEGFGDQDQTFLYYLEEGSHTIRMEVQAGALGEVFEEIQSVSSKMSLLSREITYITGTNPDPNRDWDLDKNIEHLVPRLHLMASQLNTAIERMYSLGVEKGSSQLSTLSMARFQLMDMADDINTIPGRLKLLSDTQASLGLWINGLSQQSLILDYLIVKSPDIDWPKAHANWFVRLGHSIYDFGYSFKRNFTGVGNRYEDEEVLNVWVARGRDWAQIIKQMADEDFTPNTNIKINVNIIPAGASNLLMLAYTAGKAPDTVLGIGGEVPIDFAIRNSVVNLNQYEDYPEVANRFRPGALIPYQYNGGDYALPENQNFTMLFYRTDILQEIGITEIPQTWQDVMDIIPILQQNGMDFYYPHSSNTQASINEFTPFLFQNGGSFYEKGGLKSDLESPEALAAVKEWTGLYTDYKISYEANFYNRFRTGEMPIGVADYNTYILLSVAAPELTGWWEMRPMPGIRQEDGQINRSTGGLAESAMIFKSSKMQDESWEFLKWWTSADVQERFGSELESLIGVEARWNTANVEAMNRLPWDTDDIKSIMKQWDWFKEREIVLGGYYTTRHIANIWNEIVLNGKTHREALEDAVKEINKELDKKNEEFRSTNKKDNEPDLGGITNE